MLDKQGVKVLRRANGGNESDDLLHVLRLLLQLATFLRFHIRRQRQLDHLKVLQFKVSSSPLTPPSSSAYCAISSLLLSCVPFDALDEYLIPHVEA